MKQIKKNKGFSLVEIMVVMAIIGVMVGTVIVGFSSFAKTVQLKEATGILADMLKNLELEMIQQDYKKQTVYFEEDYLVIESDIENQTLSLSWNGVGSCDPGESELAVDNLAGTEAVFLNQRDQDGNNIKITPVANGDTLVECVDFNNSENLEVQYQLSKGFEHSQVIRFIHFNLKRGSGDQVTINSNDYTLELLAPYASKTFYNGGMPEAGTVQLTLSNDDGSEDVILQK